MSFKQIADAARAGVGTIGDTAIGGKIASSFSSPMAGAMSVLGIGNVVYETNNQMKNGNGFGVSLLKSGIETALWETNPILMGAATLAPMAVQGGIAANKFRRSKAEERYDRKHNSYGVIGGGFVDTMQAQTMRQAAVQQIQGNKLNARSALGGEARIFSSQIY